MRLVQMSIQAGLLIAVVALLRFLALEKLPKTTFLILWGVALTRLLIPFSLPISLYWGLPSHSYQGTWNETNSNWVQLPHTSSTLLTFQPADASAAVANVSSLQEPPGTFSCLTPLWIGGALLLLLYFSVGYIRSIRELRDSLPADSGAIREWRSCHPLWRPLSICRSDRVTTPITVGILRPRIVLPKFMDLSGGQLLQFVLAHEYCHIRRFDALWKLLMLTAVCLHWFNPLVWIMCILANRDLEITCDEAVIRQHGAEQRSAYAYAIIYLAEQRGRLSPISSGFGKNPTEERIVSIMKYKKASVFAICLAVLLAIASITVFATDRYNASIQNQSNSSENFQGSAEILLAKLDDERTQYTITCVDQVSSHPEFEFYIEGEGIARIELYSQNEYLNIVDWTDQSVVYDAADEIEDFGETVFSKSVAVDFDEGFTEYDGLWYRWWGYNLNSWASEDNYARILQSQRASELAQLDEQERIALAAGDDGSGATGLGHVQTEGYPEELLHDTITVVLTDWEGNTCVQQIAITVKNDEQNRLHIAASLVS